MNLIVLTEAQATSIESGKLSKLPSKYKDYNDYLKKERVEIKPLRIRDDSKGGVQFIMPLAAKSHPAIQYLANDLNSLTVRDVVDSELPTWDKSGEADYSYKGKLTAK